MAKRSAKRNLPSARKARARSQASVSVSAPAPPSGPRPAPAASTARAVVAAPSGGGAKLTVRFYCQGIGDCHLLKFTKDDGGDFWMLIDCGIHSSITGGPAKMGQIVDDIATLTPRLDVIVLTHEHWDHNSAFFTARDKFKQFTVGEIWLGWTENPSDPQARQLDKFKAGAVNALQQANKRLQGLREPGPHLAALQDGLQAVMGFNFGVQGEKVRDARDAAVNLTSPNNRRYLEPTTPPFSIPGLGKTLRIYVLGPPRDAAMLGITERPAEMYGIAAAGGWPIATVLGNALATQAGALQPGQDMTAPFNPEDGLDLKSARSRRNRRSDEQAKATAQFLHDYYDGPARLESAAKPAGKKRRAARDSKRTDQKWRRIDQDWLGVSSDLAIQLDDRTNNSSLVLAFEFLESKRVVLFVGDAQVGNWLSWQNVKWTVDDKTVTGPDLLARTVFYKVGHHGSQNATLKQHGLELMKNTDLAAFIPTNAKDALKVKWGAMPFVPILDDLNTRANKRVVRADDAWLALPAGNPQFSVPSGAIKALSHDPSGNGLWVQMDIAVG